MDENMIIYIVLPAVVIFIAIANIATFGTGVYYILSAALILFALAMIFVIAFADFVLFPMLTSALGITFQPYKGYHITKPQDAVVKNVGGLYYATGFNTANLFAFVFKEEKIGENAEYEEVRAADTWEKAVMGLNFPFKFHVVAAGLDTQQIRDELEGKRSYQEYQLAQVMKSSSASDMAIQDIQRKINAIQTQIDRVSSGERPIATLMYVETTAVGVSEKAALDALSAQIKQLQIALSALDVQLVRVVGREVYSLFKFNFMLPTTYADMAQTFSVEE